VTTDPGQLPADTPAGDSSPQGDSSGGGEPVSSAAPQPSSADLSRRRWRRRVGIGVGVVLLLSAGLAIGGPRALRYFAHESTDDAYVSSNVTFVSSRVEGVANEVLVTDNQFVETGTVLVRLDPEPYHLAVEQRRAALNRARLTVDQQMAALEAAEAELAQARDQVRSQVASLRGSWFLLRTIQTFVHYQAASIRANVATLKLKQANLVLAQKEFDRAAKLVGSSAMSREDYETRQAALQAAQQDVAAAREAVHQARALLGLPSSGEGEELATVPKDIEDTFLGVQYALTSGEQTLAQLGVPFNLSGMKVSGMSAHLAELDTDAFVDNVPSVRLAQAHVREARAALGGAAFSIADQHPAVVEARKALEQAELQLRWTEIRAPISGYVNTRSVNPGTRVQPGQSLLALRPIQDASQVWIDAHFKETQLDRIRIGQPVEISADAYPGQVYHGRVAGFTPGTGAALSLLPAENATGNFVKVVQRLTVRIDLTEPPPPDRPLFVGLSVVPEIDVRATPTGPDAGQRLRGPS
jgi:membrane fusion protein (multidrug efflux system)